MLMPYSLDLSMVRLDPFFDFEKLMRGKSPVSSKKHRIQPELADESVSFDMNVRRFVALVTEEMEAVGAGDFDFRHSHDDSNRAGAWMFPFAPGGPPPAS
jgi:hypothetical protein